ncbi:D-lactaldehyde dehydrogenase [Mycena maculata]|uniref:D-lactaldehyde dehydrogenase n=1 Tax=Mycena maculata TaxID=230809 RepID=A0AAD7I951_9AGAR|nr:D-lactaldehyde dehydrogenase [Mycena maculata]
MDGGTAERRYNPRSADKGKHLDKLFASYGERFELITVPDITQGGAFDKAVKGVDAIEHTASPFHMKADDPAELLDPAIKGTVGMLESARRFGTSVKRIVVTSSSAAVLSELNWNDEDVKEVEEKGRAAGPAVKYCASKTLAEKAAWDFAKKYQGQIGWDLTVLNPPWVFGPTIHEVSSPDGLNTSAHIMYDAFTKPAPAAGAGLVPWVDVRDLALAHVRALQKEAAGAERIIVSAGPFLWQDWLDAAPPSERYQKGTPGAGKDAVHKIRYENGKSTRILGIEYRSMADTAAAVVADYEAKGW